MKKKGPVRIQPANIKVDNRGQKYLVYPDGQLRRMAPSGTPLPRVKLSKKERLSLRREYNGIRELDQKALADKIIATPVVNPNNKPVSELEDLPIVESGGITDA